MDTNSDITLAEVNLQPKKSRRRRRNRGKRQLNNAHVVQNMDQVDRNVGCSRNGGNICMVAEDTVHETTLELDSGSKPTEEHQKPDKETTMNVMKNSTKSRRKEQMGKLIKKADDGIDGSQDIDHGNILSSLSLEDACDGLTSFKINKSMDREQETGLSMTKEPVKSPSKYVQGAEHLPYVANGAPNSLVVPHHFATKSPVVCSRRKLLILDINGLLADIVMPPPQGYKADARILGRAIFERPFYFDFLKFCCERFDVGIWSSRSKKIIDEVVDYLLGDLKDKLLFCWDMCHCTETGLQTLENRHKPLVCKELRKLWAKDYPNLPWEKGDYDESNTLLIDDSPYKALLNPIRTAIFPYSYSYRDRNDTSLGPGGDLRVYLEGLAITENVQKYIEQHPFGQKAIDETSPLWGFYSMVLSSAQSTPINCNP